MRTVNEVGAFLEWGVPKDLFVPFGEQLERMRTGSSYVVFVYFDRVSQRVTGSSKLKKFLDKHRMGLETGREVDLIITDRLEAGYRAIINRTALGFIYHSDLFQKITPGQKIKGYVKSIREDGKFDLILQKPGYEAVTDVAEQVYNKLKTSGGFLPLTDDSPPGEIQRVLGISKKTFKKAIGGLYRERRIVIEEDGIAIVGAVKAP